MAQRKVILILVVTALSIASYIVWHAGRSIGANGVDLPAHEASGEHDGQRRGATISGSRAAMELLEEPLPSIDAPLSEIVASLEVRSREGDSRAACRLAAEYSYCSQSRLWEAEDARWLAERQSAISRIVDDRVRMEALRSVEREMAIRDSRVSGLKDHCEGVDLPSSQSLTDMWRRAALLGSPVAMRQYASGNAFRWNQVMDQLPQLMRYKSEAEEMALKVAQQGDVEMLLALAAGYSDTPAARRSLLAQVLQPDQAMSLAIYEHVHRSLESSRLPRVTALLGDVSAALLEARALATEEQKSRAEILLRSEIDLWAHPQLARSPERHGSSGSQRDVFRGACGRDAYTRADFEGE